MPLWSHGDRDLILSFLADRNHPEFRWEEDTYKGARLVGEDLRKYYLVGIDFEEAELSRVILSYCRMQGSNLRRADLRRAQLYRTKLQNADLTGADLRGADLSFANLQWANLTNAKVDGAIFRYTDLLHADLRGTFFLDSIDFDKAQK
jgi:uncharacterized protein YjbI with pentapeptide repeats